MITRALNPNVVKTKLDELFKAEYDAPKREGHATHMTKGLFKSRAISQQEDVIGLTKGFGLFDQTNEGIDIVDDTFEDGPTLVVTPIKFTKALIITREMVEDDQWNVVAEQTKDLGRKGRRTQDINAFDTLRGAFTNTATVHAGKFLCDTTNVNLNGDALSNEITTVFGEPALDEMVDILYDEVGHDGVLEGQMPKELTVPTKLWKQAVVLLDTEFKVGGNDNDINVYSNKYGINLNTAIELGGKVPALVKGVAGATRDQVAGSDLAFFLQGDHSVRRYERKAMDTYVKGYEYSINESTRYTARFRESYGAVDFLGTVGSLGTV